MNQDELRGLLKAKGITQRRMCDILGITESCLNRKLKGEYDFSWNEVKTICKTLEIVNPFDVFK